MTERNRGGDRGSRGGPEEPPSRKVPAMERGAGTAATGRREEPLGSRVPAKERIVAVTEQRDETERRRRRERGKEG